jgi:hypothetical protein
VPFSRSLRRHASVLAGPLLTVLSFACGPSEDDAPSPPVSSDGSVTDAPSRADASPPEEDASADADAADDAAASETPFTELGKGEVGPAGGTLTLGTVSIDVPAGAVPQDVTLSATRVDAPPTAVPASYFVFAPSGLHFAHPITVHLPLPNGDANVRVFWSNDANDGLDELPATVEDGHAVVQTSHFSTAVVALPPPPSGALCGNGRVDQYAWSEYCSSYVYVPYGGFRTGGSYECSHVEHVPISEGCDDGNTITDPCPYGVSSCLVCRSNCFLGPGIREICGDGIVNGPETCDDGNADTESCAYGETQCEVCRADCTTGPGNVAGYCGDGAVNGPETCDDGNAVTEACPYNWPTCEVCRADCTTGTGLDSGRCGDNVVQIELEGCDDGNDFTETCPYDQEPCWVCGAGCFPRPGNSGGHCSDGIVNGPETCDDGNRTTEECAYGLVSCEVCRGDCTTGPGIAAFCGDNKVNGPEQCDDGNAETESCPPSTSCTVCRANCTLGPGTGIFCGNGIVEAGEECDVYPEQSCSHYGFLQGEVSCDASCKTDTSQCMRYANEVLGEATSMTTAAPSTFGGTSYDGRVVAWLARAQGWYDIADDPAGNGTRLYVYLRGQATTRVTDATGNVANGEISSVSLDDDGSVVAFATTATNVVTPDANGTVSDCVLWNAGLHTYERIPAKSGGQPSGACTSPALSRSGRFLVLAGTPSDFGDANGGQYYLYDRSLGTSEAIDVGLGGAAPNDTSIAGHVAVSGDARYVVFVSAASNLVPNDTNGKPDVFVRDRSTGTTTRVSVTTDGSQLANGATEFVASRNATKVAFFGQTSDFYGNSVDPTHVFVRDIVAQSTTDASPPPPGNNGWLIPLTRLGGVDERGAPFFGTSVNTYVYAGGVSAELIPLGAPPGPPLINAYYTKDEQSSVVWSGPYEAKTNHFAALTLRGRDGM